MILQRVIKCTEYHIYAQKKINRDLYYHFHLTDSELIENY